MNTKTFISLLQDPEAISESQLESLSELITSFPYFQSARCLQLKGLKDQGSFLYNQELKKTAAHTTDRSVLFDFITSLHKAETPKPKVISLETTPEVSAPQSDIEVTAETLFPNGTPNLQSTLEEDTLEVTTPTDLETALGIHDPLNFDTNEVHSFSEWLQLTSLRPIQRNSNDLIPEKTDSKKQPEERKETTAQQQQQFRLIDKFIAENPKIAPVTKQSKPKNLAKEQTIAPDELMTETLAKVYLAQKKYKKAIQAYNILILKNPEKSGFFADQIRHIQQLKDNN